MYGSKIEKVKSFFYGKKQRSRMSFLPKFFCVQNTQGFSVYFNNLYKFPSGSQENVLMPQPNITAGNMIIKLRNDNLKQCVIREMSSQQKHNFKWSLTGSMIDMHLWSHSTKLMCPIIQVAPELKALLPVSREVVNPAGTVFIDELDTLQYLEPEIRIIKPKPKPTVSSIKELPSHISKLVLADSISKNEECVISSDKITMENGIVTGCGHVFCKYALNNWLSTPTAKGECPVCKNHILF
jgi:hypothetical protein